MIQKRTATIGACKLFGSIFFQMSPMVMIPGSVSNNDRIDPTTVKVREKNRTLPQVLELEKIYLLLLLALFRLLLSTITKKSRLQGVLQIYILP